MEDFILYKIIRKFFKHIVIGLMIVAIIWGLVTGDKEKGISLYVNGVQKITQPIANYLQHKLERKANRAEKILENMQTTNNE